jgi:hypothetical protein
MAEGASSGLHADQDSLGIPVKVNAYSGGKPNGVPVGS